MSIYGTRFELSEDADEGDTRPYRYCGSHRGLVETERAEELLLCEAVPWCSERPVLRLTVCDEDDVTVLLSEEQVRRMRDFLDSWVEGRASEWARLREEGLG